MAAITGIMAAIGLAEEIGVIDWVGDLLGGNKGKDVAGKIVDTAQAITGESDPVKAREIIRKDKALQAEFKKQLLNQAHELEKLAFENTAQAREMYQVESDQANKIADSVIKYSFPMIALIATLQVVAAHLIPDKTVGILIANICGAAMGYLWNERATVINFFFGSSAGSKQKQLKLNEQKN